MTDNEILKTALSYYIVLSFFWIINSIICIITYHKKNMKNHMSFLHYYFQTEFFITGVYNVLMVAIYFISIIIWLSLTLVKYL